MVTSRVDALSIPGEGGVVVLEAVAGGTLLIPDEATAPGTDFIRQGADLLLVGADGGRVLIEGYFDLVDPPSLVTADGTVLTPASVARLAASPVRYAQAEGATTDADAADPADAADAADPVATVTSVEGTAIVIRADGTRVTIEVGSEIYFGDVIETGAGSSVDLLFADGATISLGAGVSTVSTVIDNSIHDFGDRGKITKSDTKSEKAASAEEAAPDEIESAAAVEPAAGPVVSGGVIGVTSGYVASGGGRTAGAGGNLQKVASTGEVASTEKSAPDEVESVAAVEPAAGPVVSGGVIGVASGYVASGGGRRQPPEYAGREYSGGPAISTAPAVVGSSTPAAADSRARSGLTNPGVDVLIADGRVNLINGAGRIDTVSYIHSSSGVTVDLALGRGPRGDAEGDTLTGIENLIGSNYADKLTGDTGANRLEGGDGDDKLIGGLGNDKLYGDDGNDVLKGGLGNDKLKGGDGDDTLDGGEGEDVLDGGGHDNGDTASYAASVGGVTVDLRRQGVGNQQQVDNNGDAAGDTLIRIENLIGSDHDNQADKLIGDEQANTLQGLKGADTLEGLSGADRLDGGAGVDTASYFRSVGGVTVDLRLQGEAEAAQNGGADPDDNGDAEGDRLKDIENLIGSEQADKLTGDGGVNILKGGGGNDTLDGGSGADKLYGGAGKDLLIGGLGADLLNGGGDEDTASYAYLNGLNAGGDNVGVSIDLSAKDGVQGNEGKAQGDTLIGIENLIGTDYADILTGDGTLNEANTLEGKGGDDTLEGRGGADVLDGGGEDDGGDTASYARSVEGVTVDLRLQRGNPAAQQVLDNGDAGGDILISIENLIGSDKADKADKLTGDDTGNRLQGLAGNDELYGEGGNDTLEGGLGDDTLEGGLGDDLLIGGIGNDVLKGGANGVNGDTASYAYLKGGEGVTVDLGRGNVAQGGNGGAKGDTLIGIENLIGTEYNDILTGKAGVNSLDGGEGDDTLDGREGADVLNGGEGDGIDTASYARSLEGVTVDLGLQGRNQEAQQALNNGDAGGDRLISIENLIGSDDKDQTDKLTGDVKDNRLEGLKGNDILKGLGGADTLEGGEGYDTLEGGSGADTLYGGSGADTLDGGIGDDTLYGGIGDDTLDGGVGADTLDGGVGKDLLIGGDGGDTLDGGGGLDDTASYAQSGDGVTVSLALGKGSNGDAADDTLKNIENLIGSDYADILIGDEHANRLEGGAGNDELYGGGGKDTLDGGGGADLLDGGVGDDTLIGGSGADLLIGGHGADELNGGGGTDTASYAESDGGVTVDLAKRTAVGGHADGDTIISIENLVGSNSNDKLTGAAGVNSLKGLGGNDKLYGGEGDDTLEGGDGNDVLYGDGGKDTLKGGEDDDTLEGGNGNDVLYGDGGKDTLKGGEGDDTLEGGDGNDVLHGNENDDTLIGGEGTDTLSGDGGDDVLFGGLGNDTLYGGDNDDVLYGGDNDDVLYGGDNDDVLEGGLGNDTLDGGNGADFLGGGGGNDALDGGLGDDMLSGDGGDDKIVFDKADSLLVDGGSGMDTLVLGGAGDLDFTKISNSVFSGFEKIELDGHGSNILRLVESDVVSITDSANVNALAAAILAKAITDGVAAIADAVDGKKANMLVITGDADDKANIGDDFTDSGGDVKHDGVTYSVYTGGSSTLFIDNDITI